MVHGHIVLRKKNGSDGPQFPVKKSVKIGRGTHCDVRVHVQSVSEQHCLIVVEKGKKAVIQNLSSNSHTYVNGIPVGKSGCALEHGDTIAVGERHFRWQYGQQTPFFNGKVGSIQKRRKSEADSAIGSQNVAVVNPLYHKRRTLGPTISYAESLRSPKIASDLKPHSAKKNTAERRSGLKSLGRNTPVSKSQAITGTPATESPPITTPKLKSAAKRASIVKTPVVKSLVVLSKSPSTAVLDSPFVLASAQESATKKTSARKSSIAQTSAKPPEQMLSINSTTFYASPLVVVKTPTVKSPTVKTPSHSKKSKTPATRIPEKTPGSKRKSKSVGKSLKMSKGQKRRLSSPPPVSVKRIKIESPKSIDKKKMAVLMGIHGKSPRVPSSSTLSTVKVVLSGRKTPVVKPKTPHPSTSKKGTMKHPTPGSKVKSSVKKPRRPLFSEILKKKAVQKANSVAKKLALSPKAWPKAGMKKVKMTVMSTEIPKTFKFGSTGHANSPEPIIIGRKITKTPVVTKKGRKIQMIAKTQKETINLSGVSEMFQTPAKATLLKVSPKTSQVLNRSKTPLGSSSVTKRLSHSHSSKKASKHSIPISPQVQLKLSPPKSSSVKKKTSVEPTSAMKPSKQQNILTNESISTPSDVEASGSLRATRSTGAGSVNRRKLALTPQSGAKSLNQTLSGSGSRRPRSLLTSTPAVRRGRESFAETLFESPSSLLGGQFSAPQSPASGRKSRLDVPLVSSYVHSPHASPGKSSLKSSPSKSPPSGGISKNLSVSFNNSIRIKMLVPGSRRSLNTTGPLRSPASISGQDDSGTATPDITTFDFNSVKTPNVPKEMFVSSIISSGASSNGQASGSAKRKGKAVKTPPNGLSSLHGIRRLMKTPNSPTGYVDVKGVKRLMSNACKTPTYLAVEGVKKLFGDATAAAGNQLSNFAGVRELFASPSPKAKPKSPVSVISRSSARKASPVAKIQAEVESKGRSSRSPSCASQVSSSTEEVLKVASPIKLPAACTPLSSASRITRKKTSPKSKVLSPQPGSPKILSRGRIPNTKAKSADQNLISDDSTPRKSPAGLSPLKRRTRKANKVGSPVTESPVLKVAKTKTRRAVKKSATQATASPSPKRSSKKASEDSTETSTQKTEKTPEITSRRTTSRKTTAKASPSVKSPTQKRMTRRGAKASTASESPPKTKSAKRGLSPSTNQVDSPAKKAKQAVAKLPSPVLSPPRRATRRTRQEKKESPPKQPKETIPQKRKVTFNAEVITPSKKGKTASNKKGGSSHDKVSPEKSPKKSTRSKRGGSKNNPTQGKEVSPNLKVKTTTKTVSPKVSPRRTRSRK